MPMTNEMTGALDHHILNLTYQHGGLTTRQLAALLNTPHDSVVRAAARLIDTQRAYETRSARQTLLHCAVARLDPGLERPELEGALLARLRRTPGRAETATRLAQGLPLSAAEASATLERAAIWHKCRAWNVGAARLYALSAA